MARPTKLTQEVKKRIVAAIKQGATYELSSQYGGIHYDTFNRWMKQGQEETEGEFCQFYEAIKKAEGEAVVGWLRKIEASARDGNWQAAAWKLERRYPKDYGKQLHEIAGPGGGPLQVEYVNDWRSFQLSENQPTED